MTRSPRPRISVVIPTRDRAPYLRGALASLTGQTVPVEDLDVVVVDDGSRDDTRAVCEAWATDLPLRYQAIAPSGTSSAKNLGLFLSRAPIVLFFDDDDLAAPDLLGQHLAAHDRHPAPEVAVLGTTTWAPDLSVTPVMDYVMNVGQLLFSYGYLEDGQVLDFRYLWAGRTSVKRSFLAGNAVFHPDLMAVEDVELGFRLSVKGLKVHYHAGARSVMARPVTFAEFCRRSERQGEGRWLFSLLHDDPAVVEYCDVAGAIVTWGTSRAQLDAWTARVEQLELTGEPSEELFALYRSAFAAFQAKGLVEAREAAATPPGRLFDELRRREAEET